MKSGRRWTIADLTDVLGIVVANGAVHGALVRGRKQTWAHSVRYADGAGVDSALERLLRSCPFNPVARRRCTVALGPDLVVTKRLPGFEVTSGVHALSPSRGNRPIATSEVLVASDVQRYFIVPFQNPVSSTVCGEGNGDYWGALFDGDVVESTVRILRSKGVHRVTVIPVAELVPEGSTLRDTRHYVTAHRTANRHLSLLTGATSTDQPCENEVPPHALAAAAARSVTHRLRAATVSGQRRLSAVPLPLTVVAWASLGGVLGWLTAAGFGLHLRTRSLESSYDRLRVLARQEDSLKALGQANDAIQRFEGRQSSTLRVLLDAARVLDTLGWVESIVLTDSTIHLRVHAVSGAMVPRAFEALPWVRRAKLEGPVVRKAISETADEMGERTSVVLERGLVP